MAKVARKRNSIELFKIIDDVKRYNYMETGWTDRQAKAGVFSAETCMRGPMIYFLLDEDGRRIEIGVTRGINSRLAYRRTAYGDNLRLLAVMPGGMLEATAIRNRFSPLLTGDDWYRIDRILREFIEREGIPWGGGMPKTTPAYRDRLAHLAESSGIPTAMLAAVALTEWAERRGHSGEPGVQRDVSVCRSASDTIAVPGCEHDGHPVAQQR